MVEKATLARRIDVGLRSRYAELDALPWYVEQFCTPNGLNKSADWLGLAAEWSDGLDRFDRLHGWFLDGEMSAEQAEKHRQNLALLAESVPLLHRLQIALPKGAVAQWLDEHAPKRTLAEPA
jgi:hypothetical protein